MPCSAPPFRVSFDVVPCLRRTPGQASVSMRHWIAVAGLLLILASAPAHAATLGDAFTYQGYLEDNGVPKQGRVDLRLQPFDVAEGGIALSAAPLVFDSVTVERGVFTLQVDFGPAVFLGTPVFLEVGVREDAAGEPGDTSGFSLLTPRQALTPTPYAQLAERVALDAVTAQEIADGTITAADANTVSTTIGLQRRIASECAPGQAMRGASSTGAPSCSPAIANLSVGIGLDRSNIIDGQVTVSLDPTEGQLRARGRCQRNQAAMAGINADGSVECTYVGAAPTPRARLILDATGDVGSHLSVVPLAAGVSQIQVAYYDATNRSLKYLRCSGACSSAPVPVVIEDSANDVGKFVSLANVSGRPYMAYYDDTSDDLKLAFCTDANCNTFTVRTLDSGGDVGRHAAILSLGPRAAVVYFDATNNRYKFLRCVDADCLTTVITPIPIGGGGTFFSDTATNRDGNPLLARFMLIQEGSSVQMVSCTNPDCTSFTQQTVSTDTDIGPPLAMQTVRVGGLERHFIAYARPSFGNVRLQHCLDSTCADRENVAGTSTLDGAAQAMNLVGRPEGTPIYLDTTSSTNRVGARVFTAPNSAVDGSLAGSATTGGAVEGTALSDTFSAGGIAVVYYDTAAADLVLLQCLRNDCSDQ